MSVSFTKFARSFHAGHELLQFLLFFAYPDMQKDLRNRHNAFVQRHAKARPPSLPHGAFTEKSGLRCDCHIPDRNNLERDRR